MDDVDEIVKELRDIDPDSAVTTAPPVSAELATDETLADFVYEKSSELIDASLKAVISIKDAVVHGTDPKEIAALASLINATTKTIETLNNINIQNRQAKIDKELKALDMAGRSKLMDKLPANNTNVVIATREEILKEVLGEQINTKRRSKDQIPKEPDDIEISPSSEIIND